MHNLKDKIVLVTGSTRGIGKGIALVLAKKGAKIILNSPPFDPEAEQVKDEISAIGADYDHIIADVSDSEQVDEMFDYISQKYGRIDILINNAGTSQAKDVFEIDENDWNRILDTNLYSGFYCSKRAMQMMKEVRYGRIIFISSVVAHRGALYGHAHYAASKSGQIGLVKTLARTGAPLGITVNAVAPGIMETELLYKTHGESEVSKLAESIPLGLGKASDVGHAVAFLCSDEAHYITGATIDVNGGMHLR